ncbi:hypothetical protein BJ742DRAFT_894790 [Cladochytrium replicatum]|nr:hypothetical protein BJ742DRAFT_894790 [Cladochytrium replicatum]
MNTTVHKEYRPQQVAANAASASPSASSLLGHAEELERELRALLRSSRSPFDKDVGNLRVRLRDTFEQIFFADFDLALAKDVEASMWKLAHYKLIEEFRRRHKALQASVKARGAKSVSTEDRRELRALTASFRAFLSESTSFYLNFIHKIASFFRIRRVYVVVLSKLEISLLTFDDKYTLELTPQLSTRATQVCHRCLVFLGDLARYREVHADRKEKNWSSSRMFYSLALHLIPDNGNPFNQFAVIDTYEGDRLGAVERYIRSLAIRNAFPTALENLVLLFQKARRPVDGAGSEEPHAEKSPDAQFISNFIVLHWNFVGKERDVLAFTDSTKSLLSNLQELYLAAPPSDIVLSRLLLVTTGALHLSRSGMLEKLSPPPVNGSRDELESSMVRLICSMISIILDDVNTKLDSGEDLLTLPTLALRIGLRWLYARECSDDQDIHQYKDMWDKMDELHDRVLHFIGSRSQPLVEDEGSRGIITTEDLELRGFLPFHVPGEEVEELSNVDALEVLDENYERHVGKTGLGLLRAGVILEIGTKLRKRKQTAAIPPTNIDSETASRSWIERRVPLPPGSALLQSGHDSLGAYYARGDSATVIGQSDLSSSHEHLAARRPIGAERLSKSQSGGASVDNVGGIFCPSLFNQFASSDDGSAAPIDSDAVNTIGFLGLESRGFNNSNVEMEAHSSFSRHMEFSQDLLNGRLAFSEVPFSIKGANFRAPNLAQGSERAIGSSAHWQWNVESSSMPWAYPMTSAALSETSTFDPNANNWIDSRFMQPSVQHSYATTSQRYETSGGNSFAHNNAKGVTLSGAASVFQESFSLPGLNVAQPRAHLAYETPYSRLIEDNRFVRGGSQNFESQFGSDGGTATNFNGHVSVWQ